MADRIKLRRGPKNKIDLNVYELGYATDSTEKRLYFNDGSMVPIPNEKDINDIKAELTEATNVSNQNKKDVSELKESISGIIKTGVAKLVQYSYDIELNENTKKVNIPYERYSSITDTLKVYVNGLAIQNDQYTITDPVENEGIVTNGYIILKTERPAGTIVRIEVWKNVPSGEEGEVSGNIIAKNTLPLNRIIGIDDITSQLNTLANKETVADITYYVSPTGLDTNNGLTTGTPFKTIQHALDILPKSIQHTIKIILSEGNYDEEVTISNLEGTGSIYILGGNSLEQADNYKVKNIIISKCNILGINFMGISLTTTEKTAMSVEMSKYVNLQMCKCVDQCSYDGIVYQINSNGLVDNCLISNRSMAIKVMYNSIVTSSNNNGDNNTYGIGAYFTSTIGKNDTQPNGTTAEFIMAGGEIR